LTPGAFTPERLAVLEMLASQAAISLENATLYSDLHRSEAFLAQGQSLSQTGSSAGTFLVDKSTGRMKLTTSLITIERLSLHWSWCSSEFIR